VGDTVHVLDVESLGNERFRVTTGDRSYEATLQRSGEGYSLEFEGETVNFYAHGTASTLELLVGSELFGVEVGRGSGTGDAAAAGVGGPLSIRAAMPGLVREVYVEAAQAIDRGARLLVLEAMKMNNEVRSPRAGTVQAVRVAAGQRVDKGEVMVVIE